MQQQQQTCWSSKSFPSCVTQQQARAVQVLLVPPLPMEQQLVAPLWLLLVASVVLGCLRSSLQWLRLSRNSSTQQTLRRWLQGA
jgi:hypothetical protein